MVSGVLVAGRLVRMACARHMRDLDRQGAPDFPYRWDPTKVDALLEFCRDFLTLDDTDADGRPLPFRMVRWLQFAFGSLVGWLDATGHLRFVEAYFETGKGSTKTPGAAAFGLYRMVAWNRSNAENYSLGVNSDQANYLYGFAKRMAERSPDLVDLLQVGEYNLAWVEKNSFFRPLTSEGRSLDNKRVFTALLDEVHEYPSAVIPEKMRLGIKSQVDALIVMLTNAGFDKTSACWTKHDYGIKVLEGTIVDETYFPYICQLDPCDSCRDKGATQINDGCLQCDQITDERVWPKVNPAILELPALMDYTRGILRQAVNQPSTLARVKRLTFCIWTQGRSVWIPSDKWDMCRSATPLASQSDGRACAVGWDMSEKLDLTACAIGLRVEDESGPADTVELIDVDNGVETKKTLNINFAVELSVHFWLPRETLNERVKNEHIPFDVWERQGWLRVTPGPVIDYDLIYEQFRDELAPPFGPDRVGYDKHNATQFALQLRDKGRFTVVDVQQGRALSESFKLFEALVRLGRIRHNGNPVLAWCVANADPKRDRYENLWLEKASPTMRIDGVIAAVIMLSQLVLLPPRRKKKAGGARVWTPDGFRPAGEMRTGVSL